MPFKSEKQRKWMHANEPEMAKKWSKKEAKLKRETKVKSLIKKMVREIIDEGKLEEKAKRDYKAEYKKYGSSKKAKKYRAELNKYNRQKGTYGNGDGKDASHKGGKIVGFEKESVNRGRAEKSRLKKEGFADNFMKTVDKHNQKIVDNALALAKQQAPKDINKSSEKTPKLIAIKTINRMKELRNKTKSPALKKTFQKTIDKLEKDYKKLKEGKLTESKAVDKVLYMADHGYGKLGGRVVDGMSANLFKQVYEKSNDKTREKINTMNEKQLYVFMTKLWSKFGKQVRI